VGNSVICGKERICLTNVQVLGFGFGGGKGSTEQKGVPRLGSSQRPRLNQTGGAERRHNNGGQGTSLKEETMFTTHRRRVVGGRRKKKKDRSPTLETYKVFSKKGGILVKMIVGIEVRRLGKTGEDL